MAESDYTAFTAASNNALDAGDVSKGVSQAFTPPAGGGDFVLALNSLTQATGFAGWYYSVSGFNPISATKGGSISVAVRRYGAGDGYAPMFGFMFGGVDVTASTCYILGLSDSDPYYIVLSKALVSNGLDPTDANVLRKSDSSWTSNSLWFHLKLDVLVNPHSEAVLTVQQNDLTVNDVTDPVWESIDGMETFIDDSNGILTGTAPLTGVNRGFLGMFAGGFSGKAAMFDHFTISRQVNP